MANPSITEDSLKSKLRDTLKAIHVEITDMSGGFSVCFLFSYVIVASVVTVALSKSPPELTNFAWVRRLRTSFHLPHSLARIRRQEQPQAAPARQHSAQGGDRADPRMERKVSDARGVGEGEGSYWGQRRAVPRRDRGRKGGWN